MSAVPQFREELVSSPGDASPRSFDPAQLPGRVAQAVWRGTDISHAEQAVVPTGFPALDAQLPGSGWPCQSLTELLQAQPALCEWRLLAPGLAPLVSDGGQILLVGPPKRPHAPGLAQLGLNERNLVWLAADTPSERLWTTEQLVKANPRGAILAWLPQARAEQLRRLQVHAQSCDCPVFLFRPELAQRDASPAPLRVLISLGADWDLHVQILKRKGGQHEGVLVLPSIPGTLAQVLTPRLLRPSQLISRTEAPHVNALGSAVDHPSRRQLASH